MGSASGAVGCNGGDLVQSWMPLVRNGLGGQENAGGRVEVGCVGVLVAPHPDGVDARAAGSGGVGLWVVADHDEPTCGACGRPCETERVGVGFLVSAGGGVDHRLEPGVDVESGQEFGEFRDVVGEENVRPTVLCEPVQDAQRLRVEAPRGGVGVGGAGRGGHGLRAGDPEVGECLGDDAGDVIPPGVGVVQVRVGFLCGVPGGRACNISGNVQRWPGSWTSRTSRRHSAHVPYRRWSSVPSKPHIAVLAGVTTGRALPGCARRWVAARPVRW